MYDWRGHVAECTGANIFFIKDGKIHTPTADCFLDGITRRTVIGLAKQIAGLEEKIEGVEDRIDAVLARLDTAAAASKKERE